MPAGLTVLAYGALCRGLLSGRVTADRSYEGDDARAEIDAILVRCIRDPVSAAFMAPPERRP